MKRLTFAELAAEAVRYDEAVLETPDIDHFCTHSSWVLPAVRHLGGPSTPRILRSEGAYVALARTQSQGGPAMLHPLEAMWALSSPLVGKDPRAAVELLVEMLAEDTDWDLALVTGLSEGAGLFRRLVRELGRRYTLSRGPLTRRYLVDLTDGVSGFLGRRSSGFRKNLRKAERRARARGIQFEPAPDGDEADAEVSFERLLDVERRSWKGRRGVGIDSGPMCAFYREMNQRLVERGRRRLLFATLDGEDVAYILGGVYAKTYRGLQFSFDDRFSDLSLGNLCQIEQMRRLADESVDTYDLGTEVSYKKRWGDRVFTTSSVVIRP